MTGEQPSGRPRHPDAQVPGSGRETRPCWCGHGPIRVVKDDVDKLLEQVRVALLDPEPPELVQVAAGWGGQVAHAVGTSLGSDEARRTGAYALMLTVAEMTADLVSAKAMTVDGMSLQGATFSPKVLAVMQTLNAITMVAAHLAPDIAKPRPS